MFQINVLSEALPVRFERSGQYIAARHTYEVHSLGNIRVTLTISRIVMDRETKPGDIRDNLALVRSRRTLMYEGPYWTKIKNHRELYKNHIKMTKNGCAPQKLFATPKMRHVGLPKTGLMRKKE